MDTNELRDKSKNERKCNDEESFFGCKLPEYLNKAADRIDELESRLKEYDGATVIEVEDCDPCPLRRDGYDVCQIDGTDCADNFGNTCPLCRGGVIVKMKKEN